MEEYVKVKTEAYGKQAAKGQLYDAHLNEFVTLTNEGLREISTEQRFTQEQKEDAKAAKYMLLARLEWIERNKVKYKEWRASILSFHEFQNQSLDRTAIEYRKYILIAFGASFLFAFNSLVSSNTPKAYFAPLTTAIYILIGGLISTVLVFWLEGTARAKERDYAQKAMSAWDPETVRRHWTSYFRPFIDLAVVLALLTIPIAGIVFVYQVDFLHSAPLSESPLVTDYPP